MEFKRDQDKDTFKTINWWINGKKVCEKTYTAKGLDGIFKENKKPNYNTSYTTRNKKGNFIHVYHLN